MSTLSSRREVWLPHLRPGPMLLLDTLKVHKVAGVAAACTAASVRLLSLPPYAPAWSPIEAGWPQGKALWRVQAARTLEALAQAMTAALDAVTAAEAHGWFAHAGYCVISK